MNTTCTYCGERMVFGLHGASWLFGFVFFIVWVVVGTAQLLLL